MTDTRIRLFQGMPIFGGVGEGTLDFLLDRVEELAVAKGDHFFREGESGASTFVLEEGSVSLLKHWEGGEHLLGRLGRGDCFGEMALLDLGTRSASVLADVDCRAIQLTARDLLGVSKRSPEEFALIYMNLGRELSRRLRKADELLLRAKLTGRVPAEDYEFRAA